MMLSGLATMTCSNSACASACRPFASSAFPRDTRGPRRGGGGLGPGRRHTEGLVDPSGFCVLFREGEKELARGIPAELVGQLDQLRRLRAVLIRQEALPGFAASPPAPRAAASPTG